MTAKYFVDTNIFIYTRDASDDYKNKKSLDLVSILGEKGTGRISIQVLSEYTHVLTNKYHVKNDLVESDVEKLFTWQPRQIDQDVIKSAFQLRKYYNLSWWDSLILATAVLQDCSFLLSEDLAEGARYQDLLVINPLKKEFKLSNLS
jgi:predicted nucleic acid-binding protein